MTIFSSSKPDGEIFSDLPKDGLFYPAIKNKNQKFNPSAKLLVSFNFDHKVPLDKSTIAFHENIQPLAKPSNLSKYFPLLEDDDN